MSAEPVSRPAPGLPPLLLRVVSPVATPVRWRFAAPWCIGGTTRPTRNDSLHRMKTSGFRTVDALLALLMVSGLYLSVL